MTLPKSSQLGVRVISNLGAIPTDERAALSSRVLLGDPLMLTTLNGVCFAGYEVGDEFVALGTVIGLGWDVYGGKNSGNTEVYFHGHSKVGPGQTEKVLEAARLLLIRGLSP